METRRRLLLAVLLTALLHLPALALAARSGLADPVANRPGAGSPPVALTPDRLSSVPEAAGLPVSRPVAEPIATFSFVAQDTTAGISGVIVASKFFAVGSVVPWGRGDVGAIATQAYGNTTFGPRGLDLLAAGASPEQTLAILLESDPGRDSRQVGIVDARGRSATYTGSACMAWAGGRSGPGYAAQGNILTGPEVVDAMVASYLASEGQYLGDRLLAALEAGEAAGGDSRGKQSAAFLLVATGKGYAGFNDILCDLRVDDHEDPFAELRRIYEVWLPNQLITEGYQRVEEGRYDEAIALGERAGELDPDSGQPFYHLACYYARAGREERAYHYLAWAVRLDGALSKQAETDPDLAPLRGRPEWETAMGR